MAIARSLQFDIGFKVFDNELLTADKQTDELKRSITGLESGISGLGNEAEQTGDKLNDSLNQADNSATGLTNTLSDNKFELLGVFTGLTAAIGSSVVSAANFERQMTRVGQISGATGSQLLQLEDTAKKLSLESAFNPREVAEGQEFLAMAGFSVQQNMEALPDILNLASAAQMDLGRTSDITSDILTGFGLEASEMTRVVDTLQATATGANTNVAMLGESMKFVAPVAVNLGFDIETMSSALGLMANAGIKGGQAGRYLRTSLNRLASPTGEARDTMSELGIEVTNSEGNLLGFGEIVQEFETELSGLKDTQKQATLATILGQEAAGGFLAILNQGSEDLIEFRTELYNAAGITEEAANEQLNTLSGSFEMLQGSVGLLAVEIGTALIPTIQFLTDTATFAINVFNSMPDSLQNIIAFGGLAATALTGIATAVGFIAPAITSFMGLFGSGGALAGIGLYFSGTIIPGITLAFSGLATFITGTAIPAIGALGVALLANPLTWIVGAVVGLGYAVYKMGINFDVVSEKVGSFFDSGREKLITFKNYLSSFEGDGILSAMIPSYSIGSWFSDNLDIVKEKWQTFKSSIKGIEASDLLPSFGIGEKIGNAKDAIGGFLPSFNIGDYFNSGSQQQPISNTDVSNDMQQVNTTTQSIQQSNSNSINIPVSIQGSDVSEDKQQELQREMESTVRRVLGIEIDRAATSQGL